MTTRLMVTLTDGESDALTRMADEELRDPREQMRYLLRGEACRRGLLGSDQRMEEEEEQDGKATVAGR